MSIFKETFPKFVQSQLKERERIISSGINPKTGKHDGKRSNDFFTYSLNKQCILRLSSGVDVVKKYRNNTGSNLAKRYVLEGGILKNPAGQGGKDPSPRRGWKDDGVGASYGSNYISSDADDGYGAVPMPGITDASIRTKSAYGSLREGKVKFVCHNKRQLDVLEMLYMRPGYTLLLEWQWTPYFKDGSQVNDNHFLDMFFNTDIKTKEIEREILDRKEKSQGNYDALIGYCKNFSYTLRDDGGFNCETEIIAKGEVIESLKTSNGYNSRASAQSVTALEQLFEDINALSVGVKSNASILHHLGIAEEKYKKNAGAWIIPKDADLVNQEKFSTGYKIRTPHAYVRWDALAYALNSFIPKDANGEPIASFQCYQILKEDTSTPVIEPFLFADLNDLKDPFYNLKQLPYQNSAADAKKSKKITLDWDLADISTNPNVCVFDHQFEISSAYQQKSTKSPYHEKLQDDLKERSNKKKEIKTNTKHYQRNIGLTWFCVDFLKSKYRELYFDDDGNINKDYSIFKFVEAIWESATNSSEGHDFKLMTDNRPGGDIIRVVDMNLIHHKELDLDSVYELKIQSPDSTARSINYNTTIPSALSSTIAIAAQAPDSMDDLDSVSFAAINKNIEDRFSKQLLNKSKNQSSKDIIKWEKDFEYALEDLAVSIGAEQDTVGQGGFTTFGVTFGYSLKFFNDNMFNNAALYGYQVIATYGEDGITEEPASLTKLKSSAQKLANSILRIQRSYASEGKGGEGKGVEYYRGQFAGAVSTKAAVIPLKFNAKLDGIGGIIIGNVFKLPVDKLPLAYQDENIFFIVMGEEQKISSGQDWTTTISGHLILLGTNSDLASNKNHVKSWKNPDLSWELTYEWDGEKDVWEQGPGAADEDMTDVQPVGDTGMANPLAGKLSVSGGEWASLRGSAPNHRRHQGIDLSASTGTNIYAPADGKVTASEWGTQDSNGNWSACGGKITIKHSDLGITTMYCHLHERYVNVGDMVTQGQHIADAGGDPSVDPPKKYGRTTGAHLHYQVWDGGQASGTKTTTWKDGTPTGAKYSGGSYSTTTTNPRYYLDFSGESFDPNAEGYTHHDSSDPGVTGAGTGSIIDITLQAGYK